MRSVCAIDGAAQRRKMASIYWAWTWPTGDRRSYKQLLCPEHAGTAARYLVDSASSYALCFECHKPFVQDDTAVTVYMTAYFPNRERMDGYCDLHAACFEQVEPTLRTGATRLPDRGSGRGAPRPDLEPDPWEALGLAPA